MKGLVTVLLAMGAIGMRAETIHWPLPGLQLAQQRAFALSCGNQLRQIASASRLWSSENGGARPPGIQVLTNHLISSALIFCPANIGRSVATNWADVNWGQIDFEWISQVNPNDPAAISCKCRIHENVALVDGSVRYSSGYRAGWPTIVAGLLGQHVTPGADVRFEVRIAPNALAPITYQWQRLTLYYVTNVMFVSDPDDPSGGYWRTNRQANFTRTILSGQTNALCVIADVQTNHSDSYSVIVSNSMGATESRDRLLVIASVASWATNSHRTAIHCINNLRQLALLGRIWANDHGGYMPQSLAVMTNAYGLPMFGWPVVLYCRFDTARMVPTNWAEVDFSNTSYEVFPTAFEDDHATFCRCKVHGYYAQANGVVISQAGFTGITVLTNNAIQLNFRLFAGESTSLQTSTNLFHWERVSAPSSIYGDFTIYETNNSAGRFYRIRTE